jgi:transposase
MPEAKRRQCTDAFKSEAVRLTRESGRPVAQVARELGIADTVLYRWRENETRRKERDLLRRAAAFCARESP